MRSALDTTVRGVGGRLKSRVTAGTVVIRSRLRERYAGARAHRGYGRGGEGRRSALGNRVSLKGRLTDRARSYGSIGALSGDRVGHRALRLLLDATHAHRLNHPARQRPLLTAFAQIQVPIKLFGHR